MIGQRVVIDLGAPVTAEIVGLAADVRIFGQANEAPPMVYVPARQHPAAYLQAIVRSTKSPTDVASTIRRHVQALDGTLAPGRTERMDGLVAESVAEPRFAMLLIGSFAGLALTLTLVGLYATLACLVSQRRREFGIRIALDATRGTIRRMVLGQGFAVLACGIPSGILLSLFTSRIASALLPDLRGPDPLVLGAIVPLLALTSIAAMLRPAHRAARVEPVSALRAE